MTLPRSAIFRPEEEELRLQRVNKKGKKTHSASEL